MLSKALGLFAQQARIAAKVENERDKSEPFVLYFYVQNEVSSEILDHTMLYDLVQSGLVNKALEYISRGFQQ